MKTVASTCAHIDGWLIMIGVVVAGLATMVAKTTVVDFVV
jgi:hypothetical protein